jgi:hypothetical protein
VGKKREKENKLKSGCKGVNTSKHRPRIEGTAAWTKAPNDTNQPKSSKHGQPVQERKDNLGMLEFRTKPDFQSLKQPPRTESILGQRPIDCGTDYDLAPKWKKSRSSSDSVGWEYREVTIQFGFGWLGKKRGDSTETPDFQAMGLKLTIANYPL